MGGGAVPERPRLEICLVFLDPGGKLVILDVNSSEGGVFILLSMYAPHRVGQTDFY